MGLLSLLLVIYSTSVGYIISYYLGEKLKFDPFERYLLFFPILNTILAICLFVGRVKEFFHKLFKK